MSILAAHPPTPQTSVILFNLWDLTINSSDNPTPPDTPPPLHLLNWNGVLCLRLQPKPSRLCECPSTYLPHVLTSLFLCLVYTQRHTQTHNVHVQNPPLHYYLMPSKMYFLIYCVGGGSFIRKHGAMQFSLTHVPLC